MIGGFVVADVLGRGGMGSVYRARNAEGVEVALKLMLGADVEDIVARERFRREALAAASVDHPGVVKCLGSGEYGKGLWIAFEIVKGGSLADRLKRGPLPWREAVEVAGEIARALHAIHEAGIVHRDLKPANVLLDLDGVPRLTDLGIARRNASGHSLTQTGEILGTAEYIAPEQVDSSKSVDRRADLYALGIMLHALVTGAPPFRGDTLSVLQMHLKMTAERPGALVNVPPALDALVAKLLEKDPARRPANAEIVADELDRIAEARVAGPALKIVGALLALAAVIALVAALVLREPSAPPVPSPPPPPITPSPPAPPPPPQTSVQKTPSWFEKLKEKERPRLPLPKGIEFGKHDREYVSTRDPSLVLVYVPGGALPLGEDIEAEPHRGPRRVVTVSPFFIGKYEVTIGQFRRYVKTRTAPLPRVAYGYFDRQPTRSPRKDDPNDPDGGTGRPITVEQVRKYGRFKAGSLTWEQPYNEERKPTPDDVKDDRPVTEVTFDDAAAYVAWLGLELPTEAQWEYAAAWDGKGEERVGRFPWGDAIPGEDHPRLANLIDTSGLARGSQNPVFLGYEDGHAVAAPVGAFPRDRSPAGVFDMGGNVREICRDVWDPEYHRSTSAKDPVGEKGDPTVRVLRGGSWGWHGGQAGGSFGSSSRDPCGYASSVIGMRVALRVP